MAYLDVPGTYATIQDALNAGSSGDIVRLADGYYSEGGLNWGSKNIDLESANGPKQCIINTSSGGSNPIMAYGNKPATCKMKGFQLYSTHAYGWLCYYNNTSMDLTAEDIIFRSCYSAYSGAVEIISDLARVTFNTCLWVGCGTGTLLSAIARVYASGTLNVNGCSTMWGHYNSSSIWVGSGATAATVTVSNSSLWNSVSGAYQEITDDTSGAATIDVQYSNIRGGYTGTGNISSQPVPVLSIDKDNDPGVDKGTDMTSTYTDDLYGTAISAGGYNMGCIEDT